jgi:hypothetical protein
MRIEAEPGIAVSAKTVGELRKVTSWPENLVITTAQERRRMISISKPGRYAVARVVSSSMCWLGKHFSIWTANPKAQTPKRSRVSE